MGKMKKFMAAAVLLLLAVGCSGCGEDSAKKEKEYNVTLITMDQMDVHWVNVNAGVEIMQSRSSRLIWQSATVQM